MQPFDKAVHNLSDKENLVKDLMGKFNVTEEQALKNITDSLQGELWKNDTYTVLAREVKTEHFPDMIWLSIKRNDREPIHDWRDLQKIKNMIVGEENEGAELYPAESRLVDSANQFHIFCFKDPAIKFPFGFFDGRFVNDDEPLAQAKQRKF